MSAPIRSMPKALVFAVVVWPLMAVAFAVGFELGGHDVKVHTEIVDIFEGRPPLGGSRPYFGRCYRGNDQLCAVEVPH